MHGYELRKRLNLMLGWGRVLSYGSLYPALKKMLRANLITEVATTTIPTSRRPRIVYEVTEPAARVLAFLDSLSSERSTLNGSRLGTLLGDVEKLANETNPDQSARLESLEEEIEERQQLIQDISSGEFDGLLDDDEAVEAAGSTVSVILALVDRQEGTLEPLKKYPLRAAFTLPEFLERRAKEAK